MRPKRIGLYFGTFNPIHVGHLIIADYMAQNEDLDQVWFVVSPLNPLKQKASLLSDTQRLAMVRLAVEDNNRLKASNVEFSLPKPSYTVHTLEYLKEKYPDHSFVLIMGEDNLRSMSRWKNYQIILKNHDVLVYPRALTSDEKEQEQSARLSEDELSRVKMCNAPVMAISASDIRRTLKRGGDVTYQLTPSVEQYVREMGFYRK